MRTALVTGASRGIGHAIASAMAEDGWCVIGLSRTPPPPQAGLYWFQCDVSAEPPIADILALAGVDTLDAVVHAAGIRGPYGPLTDVDPDAWEQTITTNLIGAYRVVRVSLPYLKLSDDGRILLFSGGGAFSPEPGYSAYAASKGGTIALVETLAEELAGMRVTINAVAPGFVPTTIHAGTPHEHRKAEPDAMAHVVACVRHLLSPTTQGLTGRTISARFDDWASVDQTTINAVNASEMGRRARHKIQCVRVLVRPKTLVAV